jgi:hypothetical protein
MSCRQLRPAPDPIDFIAYMHRNPRIEGHQVTRSMPGAGRDLAHAAGRRSDFGGRPGGSTRRPDQDEEPPSVAFARGYGAEKFSGPPRFRGSFRAEAGPLATRTRREEISHCQPDFWRSCGRFRARAGSYSDPPATPGFSGQLHVARRAYRQTHVEDVADMPRARPCRLLQAFAALPTWNCPDAA